MFYVGDKWTFPLFCPSLLNIWSGKNDSKRRYQNPLFFVLLFSYMGVGTTILGFPLSPCQKKFSFFSEDISSTSASAYKTLVSNGLICTALTFTFPFPFLIYTYFYPRVLLRDIHSTYMHGTCISERASYIKRAITIKKCLSVSSRGSNS